MSPTMRFLRHIILLVAALALAGCAALPADGPKSLGATLQVRDSLAESCKLSFTSVPAGGELTRHTGVDERGIYAVALLGTDDQLMRASYMVLPEQEPFIGRPNLIDNCLINFLSQLGQVWLQPWYYERIAAGEAVEENQEMRATLLGVEGEQVVLELTALDFAERVTGVGSAYPGNDQPAPAVEGDCGQRIVAGLGGQRLNLRAAPGTDAAILAKLPEGTEVSHLCTTQKNDGRIWARIAATVEGATVEGWVSEEFLASP